MSWRVGTYSDSPFEPRIVAWLGELGQLLGRPVGYGYAQYSASDWRAIQEFAATSLWPMLADGMRMGVALVGNAARDRVELATTADIALEVTSAGVDGLRIRPRVTFDGEPTAYHVLGLAGPAGLYTVRLADRGRHLLLGPAGRRLSDAEQALIGFEGLSIPSPEVPEFWEWDYPKLRRRMTLRCFDDSVALPEPPRPRLVLGIAAGQTNSLRLAWGWAYAARRYPFHWTEDPVRDPAEEIAVRDRVEQVAGPGFLVEERTEISGIAAVRFGRAVLPVLEACDEVIVEAAELPAFREIEEAPQVTVGVRDSDEPDWFDLAVSVSVEGRQVPFAPLFAAIARGEEYLVLDDGSYLRTDLAVLERLRELIHEARRLEDRPGPLRLNRYAASLWGDFEDLAEVVEQTDRWRESVGALAALGRDGAAPLPVPLPSGLTAELRPYQRQAFDWLAFLYQHGLGGILADDMGLGKTVEVLALLEHVRAGTTGRAAPFLVVAPASVIANWEHEARRFTPDLRVAVLPTTLGRLGMSIEQLAATADVVVTSYAIFRLDFDNFAVTEWAGLVLDEAQFLKNPKTRANECARLLKSPFKLAVTGTPLENNLMELWAMLAVVAPGLYGSATRFRDDYVKTVQAGLQARNALRHGDTGRMTGYGEEARAVDVAAAEAGEVALARLRRRIRPLLLRRTKEQVAPELPDRLEQEVAVELAPKHRRAYDLLLQRERQRVLKLLDEDFEGNRFTIFRSITLLRRAALDISLTHPERHRGVPSAKLEVLFEQLEDVVASGHRALVFSQFTSFLTKIAERAHREGIAYAYLDGKTARRATVIEGFKTGDAPLFLISLKAGGFGLNLTEADYVFLMDPWWNPASESQAVDRTHRIGQTRNVMVFRLVSANTIEEKVMALKTRKAQLFDAVLSDDDGSFAGALGVDDIRGLFDR